MNEGSWAWVLVAWLLFAGWHLVFSSRRVRAPLIARFRERGFQGLYSLGALATFVWLVVTYAGAKHAGPTLWHLASIPAVRWLSIGLTALFLTTTVAAMIQPNPVSLGAAPGRARGFTRITRHPGLFSFGLVGLSHTLVNPFLADVVFFAGFAVFAVVGCAHMDARKRAADDSLAEFYAETSFVPFGAIASGRNRLGPVLGEFPLWTLGAGLAVTAVILYFHPTLFGGRLLPL